MSLSNKYNIPQETVNKMVKDGVISCTWPMYEEIYSMYKAALNTGKSKTAIYNDIAEKKNISESLVKQVVLKLDKI